MKCKNCKTNMIKKPKGRFQTISLFFPKYYNKFCYYCPECKIESKLFKENIKI